MRKIDMKMSKLKSEAFLRRTVMASADYSHMEEALLKGSMGGFTDLTVVSRYLFKVFWNALTDRTEELCYVAIVLNHAFVGGIASMLVAFSVFLYAIPQRPFPSRHYWDVVVGYISLVIFLKLCVSLPIFWPNHPSGTGSVVCPAQYMPDVMQSMLSVEGSFAYTGAGAFGPACVCADFAFVSSPCTALVVGVSEQLQKTCPKSEGGIIVYKTCNANDSVSSGINYAYSHLPTLLGIKKDLDVSDTVYSVCFNLFVLLLVAWHRATDLHRGKLKPGKFMRLKGQPTDRQSSFSGNRRVGSIFDDSDDELEEEEDLVRVAPPRHAGTDYKVAGMDIPAQAASRTLWENCVLVCPC